MPYKKGKFKCSKCDNPVYRKETILCMGCRAKEKTGETRVDKDVQKKKRRKYKQEYFQKNKERIYQRNKLNPIDKEKEKHYYIKSRYGISKKEYEQMLVDRNFTCDICGYKQPENAKKMQKLYIDHCHTTNVIRGLLCFSCNTGLGYFKDNIENITKTIKYLKRWQEN
jgi:hypothetical protein